MTKAARRRRMPPRYKSGPKKGRFMSKAARRRKNPRPAVAANPRRRRRRVRKNPVIGGRWVNLRAGGHTGTKPKRRRAATKRGGTTVAKRRKHARKAKRSHRSYVLSAKKAARTRATKKAARRAAAKKAHRKTRRRHTARKTVTRRRKHVARKPVTRRRRRRARRAPLLTARRGVTFRARGRRGGKIQRRRLRAHYPRSAKGRLRLGSVRANPNMAGLKSMLMSGAFMFGGLLACRVLANVIRINVTEPYLLKNAATMPSTGTTAKLIQMAPAAAAFALGLFVPKFIKNPKIVAGIQTGAALVLFDALFTKFVYGGVTDAKTKNYLNPSMGVSGFGYYGGEYIAQRPRLPMMGAVAREAMALDEYVQQPGMGAFDVNEALAGSEVQAMQTGYAGGSLARTLFSS